MIENRKARAGVWTLLFLAVLALSVPLLMGGCSGCQKKQEPPPPPPKVEQPAPAPVEKAAAPSLPPPPTVPALGAVVPVTLSALKLAPESAMITLALPPLQGTLDKGIALAKKILPPGTDVDGEVAKSITQMAQDAGVPDAKTIAEIASAKGLNAEAPIALFVDLTNTAGSAKTALTAMKADLDAQKAAPAPEAAPKAEGAAKTEAAPAAEKPAAPKALDLDKVVASLKPPAVAAVLGCSDPAKVEATIGEVLGVTGGYVDPAKVETSDVGGVSVKCFDPEKLAYAVAGDKLVVSNSLEMLKQVLGRVASPAVVRYGSVECPASSPDEVVLLSRMDKIAPIAKELLPLVLALQPDAGQMPEGQLDYMNKMFDALAGDDPSVCTLEWTDKKIELAGRYDLGKHPGMAELAGEAQPLRLAPMLPDNTLLFLSVRLNEKTKAQIKDGWIKSLPPEVKNEAGLSKALPYVETVLSMLGDEISVGIAGAAGGLPQVYLMAGLGNAEQAKGLIQLAAPMTPSDPHEGVEISLLAIPSPVPVYIAFVDNTLMVCNDLEKLKGLITLAKAKSASKLFTSLDPAMDPATPSFGALLVKSALVTDVVRPLAAFMGGLPPEMQGPVDKVVSTVREIRATKTLQGGWAKENLSIYLN